MMYVSSGTRQDRKNGRKGESARRMQKKGKIAKEMGSLPSVSDHHEAIIPSIRRRHPKLKLNLRGRGEEKSAYKFAF
jgi:hypothetical protein